MTTPELWQLNRSKQRGPSIKCADMRIHLAEAEALVESEGVTLTQQKREYAQQVVCGLSDPSKIRARARTALVSIDAAIAEFTRAHDEGKDYSLLRCRWHSALRAAAKAADGGNARHEVLAKAAEVFRREVADEEPGLIFANVSEYRKEGIDLIVSWTTLSGASFDTCIRRGASVQDLAHAMRQETRFANIDAQASIERLDPGYAAVGRVNAPSKAPPVRVAVIGPKGTRLDDKQPLPEALDYEADASAEVESEKEDGQFYPLEVLTGSAWRELGLDGATRWQFLREVEFNELFGMSKASFRELPSWKQKPLKQKHGLF